MPSKRFENCPPASLWRQLAAMVYDSFLIVALLFFAFAILVAFNRGEAVEPNLAYTLFLLFVVFTFYAWFWHKSGQTLGMSAWKIRIVSEFGGNPSWAVGYLRLLFALLSWACLGLGYWWRLFKPYTWHDRLSQTRILYVKSAADDPPPAPHDV
ncbi:MAG: RDD family protein [Gammaproteobacteria bacterium]|nr:RDD family protein [Gammaproteobacteria bacterium]